MAQRDVLIIVNGPIGNLLNHFFLDAGDNCLLASDGREGLAMFRRSRPMLIVTDLSDEVMSGGELVRVAGAGIGLLKKIRQEDPDAAVIVIDPWPVETTIASLKLGAYICLWFANPDELMITAERALERRQLLIEHREYQRGTFFRRLWKRLASALGVAKAQRHVLIVVDDREAREGLHRIFLKAGYTCREAPDGRAGLEEYRAWKPPLIVTGLKMPVVSGTELAQQVRLEDPDAAIVVIDRAIDWRGGIDCLKLGAYASLLTPLNADELLIVADRALERRQLLIERRQYQVEASRRKSVEP